MKFPPNLWPKLIHKIDFLELISIISFVRNYVTDTSNCKNIAFQMRLRMKVNHNLRIKICPEKLLSEKLLSKIFFPKTFNQNSFV
jgi:hypothetical protein